MTASTDFDIERVGNDITFDTFFHKYFEPEKPVVLEAVGSNWLASTKWNKEYLQKKLSKESSLENYKLYFAMDIGTLDLDYEIPSVIAQLVNSDHVFPLINNTRIWINSRQNTSHWHYDSNIESVFNIQIKGRKEWNLVSPQTPLPCYPFTNFALLENNRELLKDKVSTNFILNEGDMLYIPPLWFHQVTGLDQENINLNWVMTKKNTKVTSSALTREMEIYWIDNYFRYHNISTVRNWFSHLDSLIPPYLKHVWRYENLTETENKISKTLVVKRILKELIRIGNVLMTAKKIRHTFRNVENVPPLAD